MVGGLWVGQGGHQSGAGGWVGQGAPWDCSLTPPRLCFSCPEPGAGWGLPPHSPPMLPGSPARCPPSPAEEAASHCLPGCPHPSNTCHCHHLCPWTSGLSPLRSLTHRLCLSQPGRNGILNGAWLRGPSPEATHPRGRGVLCREHTSRGTSPSGATDACAGHSGPASLSASCLQPLHLCNKALSVPTRWPFAAH